VTFGEKQKKKEQKGVVFQLDDTVKSTSLRDVGTHGGEDS
jgi:hypothetical protein